MKRTVVSAGKTGSAHCVSFKVNCFFNPLHNRSFKDYQFTEAPSFLSATMNALN
ncbi:hypothetical protein [Cardinium endosymbiont of Sogatella furcifera]|uniref:hypothetical protein n=1 Tax=Cardinium endosymbiont of Sogatella furcifera TaxID=650378 RepID=UPI0013B3B2ED|nr:hypothetical protein [Cardinium endosymbiont of Sogatella furcifera]